MLIERIESVQIERVEPECRSTPVVYQVCILELMIESISEESQKLSYLLPNFHITNLLHRTMEKVQVLGEFI